MKTSDSQEKLFALVSIWGLPLGIASLLGWAIDKFLPDQITFSSRTVSVILMGALVLYVGTLLQMMARKPSSNLQRPRIVLFKPEGGGLLVVMPVDWLAYLFVYSLFVAEDDGFERAIGVAQVINIQDDKKVQLSVVDRNEAAEKVWNSLQSGSTDYFSKIIIKPGALPNG